MGCDGGSIPRRVELVRTRSRPVGRDERQRKMLSWRECALSKEPLRAPVVACRLGRLYNKEAVLRLLLDRHAFGGGAAAADHIRSLKDVISLRMTENPAFRAARDAASQQTNEDGACPFVCPATGREMNGNFRFLYLRGCGCVLSAQACREVDTDTCLKCGQARAGRDDQVELNASGTGAAPAPKRAADPAADDAPRGRKDARREPTALPYLPNENGYHRPSLSGLASFRKTPAVGELYRRPREQT